MSKRTKRRPSGYIATISNGKEVDCCDQGLTEPEARCISASFDMYELLRKMSDDGCILPRYNSQVETLIKRIDGGYSKSLSGIKASTYKTNGNE